MDNNYDFNKCKKHDLFYEIKLIERGKTLFVCPKCENEREKEVRDIFAKLAKADKFGLRKHLTSSR